MKSLNWRIWILLPSYISFKPYLKSLKLVESFPIFTILMNYELNQSVKTIFLDFSFEISGVIPMQIYFLNS